MYKQKSQHGISYRLLLLIIFLSFCQISITQNNLSIAFDAGISFPQFPEENSWTEGDDYYLLFNSKKDPLIDPLIGISTEWTIFKHLRITSGLQFQRVRTRSYTITQVLHKGSFYYDYESLILGSSYSEDLEDEILIKLCFPITVGYQFNFDKIKPSIYLGVRPNLYLAGNITYNSIFLYSETLNYTFDRSSSFEYEKNIFGPESTYFIPARKFVNQFSFGISTDIGKHFSIYMNYNTGYNYFTDIIVHRGNHSTSYTPEKKAISSSDYLVHIVYKIMLPAGKKNKEEISVPDV